uniref:Putative signal transducing adaptor protein stam/stam2 n=1 Tax=Xenopsylla cheopis TaxID=163159 RepID=A0A6M2DJX5_XENCH
MGIFNISSPFDADIEKATSENNTSEQWGAIMDVCDKVGSSAANAKDCLRSIVKRLLHPDPHVVVQAITLLDACVNNCGNNFHLEVASRDFENEYRKLLSKSQPPVAQKLKQLLKKWAEGEFKSDPQLNLIPSLYNKLKSEGVDFSDVQPNTPKQHAVSKDPNVVSSQQEEDDIAKAIELSLKDKNNSVRPHSSSSASSSLYPTMQLSSPIPSTSNSEPRKVRALYDFEAAEDNELTFLAGEIIHMIDDSDPNWWKGYNQHGEGLFPANFVTADLSVEPEQFRIDASKKSVQFSDAVQVKTISQEDETSPEINEESIDTLLNLLHEANPEDPNDDTEQMLNLEVQVNKMGPLIDAELENIDRKHAQLTQLSGDLVEALNLYHTLMREPERRQLPQNMYAPQGLPNPNMPQQMYPPREFMTLPPNSMGMTMPAVYSMGPQMIPSGMVPPGQMNMSLPPVVGIPPGNPQISQNNPQPHSLNSTMAQTNPMPQAPMQRVPNPQMNLHNMNAGPTMIPNAAALVNQNQPPMQLVQNNSQMSLGNQPPPMGQPQPSGPNPMLIHQMSQHLNGLHIANGMGNVPVSSHMNPNDETQQNVQFQQRMGTNIYMQGPQALPGQM